MAEGVTFFIVQRGRGQILTKRGPLLEDAADARKHRALVIPDEDIARFVNSGAGEVLLLDRASRKPTAPRQLTYEQEWERNTAYWEETKSHWIEAMMALVIGHRNLAVFGEAGVL
jgi:hypothetical protein